MDSLITVMVVALVVVGSLTGLQGVRAAPAHNGGAVRGGTRADGSAVAKDVLLGCKDKPAEIYFLLDCSSSVWIVDFDKQKDFVVSLVEHLDIQPNATRVGLGVFSDDFYHVLDIGGYPDKGILIRAIKAAPYYSGNTYTGKAIRGMRTHGFRAGVVRPNVTKIGVVITDGLSRHRTNTVAEATRAREEHIWLFAIGVGGKVDEDELAAIASVPEREFSFHVPSFDILATLSRTLAISTCSLQQPQSDGTVCGREQRADVMFVYAAGSLGRTQLSQVKAFVSYLITHLSMATGNIRVGLISKGSQGGDINLEQYIRGRDFIEALEHQPPAMLSPLFKKLRLQGFDPVNGGRHNAKKLVVAFVDDAMADRNDVLYEALLLKYQDTLIHVVALGDTVDLEELKQLATSPSYIRQVGSYGDLEKPGERKAFLDTFCKDL